MEYKYLAVAVAFVAGILARQLAFEVAKLIVQRAARGDPKKQLRYLEILLVKAIGVVKPEPGVAALAYARMSAMVTYHETGAIDDFIDTTSLAWHTIALEHSGCTVKNPRPPGEASDEGSDEKDLQ